MSSKDASSILPEAATTAESSLKRTFVTETLPNDVLLGRGSHLVKYEGNIEFRRLIQERKGEYVLAVRHSHKDQIARDVISIVTSRNGRFLRKVDNPIEMKKFHIPTNMLSAWVLVETEVIVEKIKQAFRDSCKDERPPEQNQQHSCSVGYQEIKATDSLTLSSSKSLTGRKEVDVENNGPIVSSIQVKHSNEKVAPSSQAKQSTSFETDHFKSEQRPSHIFHNQGYHDAMITQQLLQYQQNQRLLLEHLASQHSKPAASSEVIGVKTEWPTRSGNPHRRCPTIPIYQNVANNMVDQHLQTQKFQLAIQSELSRQSLQPVGHQAQHNISANTIPNNSQYLYAPTNRTATGSMVGQEQTNNIFRALQRHELEPTLLQHDLSPLINSPDILLAIQHNPSLLPLLTNHSALSRGQALLNDRIFTAEFAKLLSGLAPNSLILGTSGENNIDSTIASETPLELNATSPSTSNSASNSLLRTAAFGLKTEGDNATNDSPKHCIDANISDGDEESVARKKIRVAKQN